MLVHRLIPRYGIGIMHGNATANAKKLAEIVDGDPLRYNELLKRSGFDKGTFTSARRVALKNKWITVLAKRYCLPGQEELANEKASVGAIGNRQRLALIKDTFHEIFMLRLSAYGLDDSWKRARKMAERIEPVMQMVKEKDPNFPYSHESQQAFEYHPEGFTDSRVDERAIHNWQKYCADILEYCDRKLRPY